MAKIITVTFNPTIDKSTEVKGLIPEKKLRCSPPIFGPGGGGINVSRALKNLGKESLALYPSGGHSGKMLNDLMEGEGLTYKIVETKNRTRENFIVLETTSNQQYRFGMPGNEIYEEECEALIHLIEEQEADFIVASGSLLPGMPADILMQIAQIAKDKRSKLILDTSGEALKKALEVGVYLLKPNVGELSSLVGQEEVDDSMIENIGKEIIQKGQCEVLVVSMGAQGAKLISNNESIHIGSPVVKRVSTLGAGDSMVAGMVLSVSQKKSLREVLQYGIACGTAATMTHGSELCRREDVERLLKAMKLKSN
ncbi:MAG TPA: 1-phosphofructokinase family hexose kinase [Flavisolibacter sp.]|nr:1-phosphofructokinase family hexose kinase [Flavisolibacter sp.]